MNSKAWFSFTIVQDSLSDLDEQMKGPVCKKVDY